MYLVCGCVLFYVYTIYATHTAYQLTNPPYELTRNVPLYIVYICILCVMHALVYFIANHSTPIVLPHAPAVVV